MKHLPFIEMKFKLDENISGKSLVLCLMISKEISIQA